MRLLDAAHQAELAHGVNYAALVDTDNRTRHDLDQPELPFHADGQLR